MQGLPDITPFRKRLSELDSQMASADFFQDQKRVMEVSREHQRLTKLLDLHNDCEKLARQLEENAALENDSTVEEELRLLAAEEKCDLENRLQKAKQTLLEAMLPPDSSDSRNTVVEIRAGTGGEEAALFAGDLYRMYCRFAEKKGWTIEPLNSSPSEVGGFREVCFLVKGEEVYKTLKFEGGGHRVQRIPTTEANGRIHTSAATVAVLPEAEEIDISIRPDEIEVTICRASGPGGQGVNTTDSAVQILHKPSGMIVTCADERSQQKNRVKAMTVLRSRLLRQRKEEEEAKYAATRKTQVGSGDRSERIRTYNFPQNRLTDHRIGLTLYSLSNLMEGDLDALVDALQQADLKLKIEDLLR
ncbi:MAG: peptide chain release factor 1 [Verrucomicrobia bacterium GWF2_51_19]|nr:MAG: peptide chain release factor 1 [Verrucomicrobia bacterium GWF2_51_19]HCJ11742.1 peptide chain release factor 1 [Opitutae bacterium]